MFDLFVPRVVEVPTPGQYIRILSQTQNRPKKQRQIDGFSGITRLPRTRYACVIRDVQRRFIGMSPVFIYKNHHLFSKIPLSLVEVQRRFIRMSPVFVIKMIIFVSRIPLSLVNFSLENADRISPEKWCDYYSPEACRSLSCVRIPANTWKSSFQSNIWEESPSFLVESPSFLAKLQDCHQSSHQE